MNYFSRISRRNFLAATGALASATAIPGFAAPTITRSRQKSLQNFVDMRFGMFNHFNMGTFSDEEWATPNLDPRMFAPPSVDCAQWAAAAKSAGMQYGVLTTKHHDGFCLWPSKYNSYNVSNSSYQRDIVADYVTAFRAAGLKVGIYFSIWDRTRPVQAYGGHVDDQKQAIQSADIAYVLNQITELLTNYGTIDVFVNDGYAWQMGQQAVPYQQVRALVKSLQPNILMIDHGALSVPWLGDAIYFEEPLGVTSPAGNTYASVQGTTITPAGWFWHPQDPTTEPMSQADILAHLKDLEPKWTSYLLNCPPNRAGRLDDNIVARLAAVGAAWQPNLLRSPLPIQQARCENPITPVSAYASSWHDGEGPLRAIDGRSDRGFETCWSTWSPSSGSPGSVYTPQSITIDLGGQWSSVTTLEYLPKQWNRNESTDGDITSYSVFTSTDGVAFTLVASGTWPAGRAPKLAEWNAVDAGFVRLQAESATGGYCNVSELRIGGRANIPRLLSSSTAPAPQVTYRIINFNSRKPIGVNGNGSANGTSVTQVSRDASVGQMWTFEREASGYFKIRNVGSGSLLEIGGLTRSNGGTADIWQDAGAPQQQWSVTPVGSGMFMVINRFSGLSLNVDGAALYDGATINQYDYNAVVQEHWILEVAV